MPIFLFQIEKAETKTSHSRKRNQRSVEDNPSTVTSKDYARVVQKLKTKRTKIVHLEQELEIERSLSRRLQAQLLDRLGKLLYTCLLERTLGLGVMLVPPSVQCVYGILGCATVFPTLSVDPLIQPHSHVETTLVEKHIFCFLFFFWKIGF